MRYLSLLILLVGLTITTSATPAPSPAPIATPLALGDLRFDWPIPNAIITSPFGYRNDVNPFGFKDGNARGGGDSIHMGIDMIPPVYSTYAMKHTPVQAAEAGDVWIVFPPPGTPVPGKRDVYYQGHPEFGGCVMLRHIAGRYNDRIIYAYTLYGHMREVWVSEGMKIKKGDLLGLMGSTGVSTGPHVHFEILFNPMDFLMITSQAQKDVEIARIRQIGEAENQFWNYK